MPSRGSPDDAITTTGIARVRLSPLSSRNPSSPLTFGSFKSKKTTRGGYSKRRLLNSPRQNKKSSASSPSLTTWTLLTRWFFRNARNVNSTSSASSSTNRISISLWLTAFDVIGFTDFQARTTTAPGACVVLRLKVSENRPLVKAKVPAKVPSGVTDRSLRAERGHSCPLPLGFRLHPGGMFDHSPTFQRWVADRMMA